MNNTRTSLDQDSIRRDYEPGTDTWLYTLESRSGDRAIVVINDATVADYDGDGAWAFAQRHALALLSDREIRLERASL
jgi:hypothetical protein